MSLGLIFYCRIVILDIVHKKIQIFLLLMKNKDLGTIDENNVLYFKCESLNLLWSVKHHIHFFKLLPFVIGVKLPNFSGRMGIRWDERP